MRIYHESAHTPDGHTHRGYGPLYRFDPHVAGAGGSPGVCADGRTVLYVADTLATGLAEVFGDQFGGDICPAYRAAIITAAQPLRLLDIATPGAAMRIGAYQTLGAGEQPRRLSQEWARAIHDDQPADGGTRIRGVYYRTAHTGGAAVALWNCDGEVGTATAFGVRQDFALHDIWGRVVVAAESAGMTVTRQSTCPACP